MISKIGAALSATAILLTGATAAQATDPCAGYDVACDSDGCLVCWPDGNSSIDVICEEMSLVEVNLTLPGCVGAPPGIGLVAPQAPRLPELLGTGGRTVLPEPTVPERQPGTNFAHQG